MPAQARTGEMVRAAETRETEARVTPWEFDGAHLYPAAGGSFVAMAVAEPGPVTWTLRRGYELVWKQRTVARDTAVLALPAASLAPGKYQLEAESGGVTRRLEFEGGKDARAGAPSVQDSTLVSYNANLRPAERNALLGHQWLLRGKTAEAADALRAALPLRQAQIDLARLDALAGRYDDARALLQPLLRADANDFDALSVMAYVEAKLPGLPGGRRLLSPCSGGAGLAYPARGSGNLATLNPNASLFDSAHWQIRCSYTCEGGTMCRFTTFVLGTVLALSPAVAPAQDNRQAPSPRQNNFVTSGEPATDQNNMRPATQAPATAAPIGGDYSHAATGSANRSMPDTASGWLGLLLGGSLLGTAGVSMRRLLARG